MDFGGLVVATGLTSFLCLLASMLFLFRWRYRINKADKSRIENKCDYERMETLGFTVVNVQLQQDNNSLLEAVADQLIFSGVNKKATVKGTQRKIYEYFQNVSTSYLVAAYRYLKAKAILVKPKYDDLLYAIANIYKVTIEVVNAGTLESRIIRPLHCKSSERQQIKGLFIGYTRNSRFVSLRKLPEPKVTIDDLPAAGSITQSKERPIKICHNDTVGNKTELDITNPRQTVISIGDNQTNVLDCGDVFEKITTITVGTNNVQQIRCNLRTPKDVLKCAKYFYENKSECAEIKLKITCKGDGTKDTSDYEDLIFKNLQSNLEEFQSELDAVLDVEVVRVEKGCILLTFKSRSIESAVELPVKFFSSEFETLIRFMLRSLDMACFNLIQFVMLLEIKFHQRECVFDEGNKNESTTRYSDGSHCNKKTGYIGTFGMEKELNKGICITVKPKKDILNTNPRLSDIPEHLVKAALTSINKEGILKPNTEVDVTLKRIICKHNNPTIKVRPLSNQKGSTDNKEYISDEEQRIDTEATSDKKVSDSETFIRPMRRKVGDKVIENLPKLFYVMKRNITFNIAGKHRKLRYFALHDELDYQEVGYMTGIIKGKNGLVATAFRAGHDFVLTTYHFVSATDEDQIEVVFKDEGRGKKLKLIFFNKELDVALLEIQSPSKKVQSVLYITDASPGDDIYIVGHTSKNKLKKERTTCLNWRNIDMSSDCEKYILFHSEKFGEGSSGAPCVKIHDNKLCVVSILIGELIGAKNSRAAHLGVNMMALYSLMLKQDKDLCHSVFQVVDNRVDTCYCKEAEDIFDFVNSRAS